MKNPMVFISVNIAVFIALRYLSFFIALFGFSYGASANDEYDDVLFLPGLILQIAFLLFWIHKKKESKTKKYSIIVILILITMYVLKEYGYLSFVTF